MAEELGKSKTSHDFLNDAGYRLNKVPWFLSVGICMEEYKKYVADVPQEERLSVGDFIKKDDIILEMMLNDTGCYDKVVNIFTKYAGVE